MFRVLIPFFVILSISYGNVLLPNKATLVGQNTKIESFPYQVSVRLFGSHICSGSILNSRVVITAGHCIYFSFGHSYYSIQYGSADVKSGETLKVVQLDRHGLFDSKTNDYDIALIHTRGQIKFGLNSSPIALATNSPVPGTHAIVTGWSSGSNYLQKFEVKIVNHHECRSQYGNFFEITDRMLCAGDIDGGKHACQRDSGCPLVVNNELVGFVSVGCTLSGYPGVYTNVSHMYSWIKKNMEKYE